MGRRSILKQTGSIVVDHGTIRKTTEIARIIIVILLILMAVACPNAILLSIVVVIRMVLIL